ncbi:hypothetical protein BVX93_01455 [bacterium B13(2017)]|nr:hypothetical protein BVX93_01455 [bacterium B13(2017)]
MPKHKSIGALLLEQNSITEEQLQKALAEQSISNKRLGDILIDLGFVTEEQVVIILSEQMGLAYIDLNSYEIEREVLDLIDKKVAHHLQVIPIFKIENSLTVVMVDPLNIQTVDELNKITGYEIQPVFGTKVAIQDALEKYYIISSELDEAIEAFHEKDPEELFSKKDVILDISKSKSSEETPAIKFVNIILNQAIKDGASDIHFEPNENDFSIRCRIDGILHPLSPPPKSLQGAILSRLKVLANLDIAEKRLPQDGRVQISNESKKVDLRISSFPTVFGENIVIRILDKSLGILSMDKLGIQEKMLLKIKEVINIPNGIILVTGPTGSGKTTTLYSFLNEINSDDKNIMTMEDPVEYQIKGIRQAQVDVKAGLTFNLGLRSILRQDPDIIMIGEIRDLETAEIAIQSALTGHLVFSTLHTNDAASTVTRLIDMGIEPFLISSSISGIIAQKLIRKLCDFCKEPYKPTESLLNRINIEQNDYTFYKEIGCDKCKNTGYRGRVGVYELFTPSSSIRQMINEKKSAHEIEMEIKKQGFINKRMDGINKVILGITSITEVLKDT